MKLRLVLIVATVLLGGVLLSGVVLAKTIRGGPNHDQLSGTNNADYIKGNGGADDIDGKKGNDTISGGKGNDSMRGGRGGDSVGGGPASDVAWGNQGRDTLLADIEVKNPRSRQAAKAKGGRKPNKLLGAKGNDTFRARNGKRDIIRGGPGRDKAYVDRVDDVQGVEKKVIPPPPPPNNPPVAVDDTKTVAEDDPATTIDVLANDTDADGGTKTIESVMQPADGSVAITNGGSDLTYQPNLNYCNNDGETPTDDFTYTLNGGSTATVAVTVTCQPEVP
jgi:hypothetical protein